MKSVTEMGLSGPKPNKFDLPKFAIVLSLCAALAPLAAFALQYLGSSRGFFSSAGGLYTIFLTLLIPGLAAVSWRSMLRPQMAIVLGLMVAITVHAISFGEQSAIVHTIHIAVLMFAAAIVGMRDDSHEVATRIAIGTAIGGGSLVALSVISMVAPDILTPKEWTYSVPGFMNIRVVGQMCTLGALVALPMAVLKRSYFWLAILFASLTIIFWTGSRGGIVAIFFGILAVLITHRGIINKQRLPFVLLTCLAGFLAAASSLVMPRFTSSFHLLSRLIKTGELAAEGKDPTSNRLTLWSETLEKAVESPFLGNGLLRSIPEGLSHVNAHNFALDILFGYGLVIGGVFLILITHLWYRSLYLGAKRSDDRDVIHIALIGGIFPFALIEPVLFSPIVRATFAFSLVALLSGPSSHKASSQISHVGEVEE
jgi:hypothetical protein